MAHPDYHRLVTGSLSQGVNRFGSEVEQSFPSGVEVKSEWSCTSPPYAFVAYTGSDLSSYYMGNDHLLKNDSYP